MTTAEAAIEITRLGNENKELMHMLEQSGAISDNWMKRYGEALVKIKNMEKTE